MLYSRIFCQMINLNIHELVEFSQVSVFKILYFELIFFRIFKKV